MKKIALYDIDYTIISVNSLVDFVFYILSKYPQKIIYLPYLAILVALWVIKLIPTKKIKESFLLIIQGFDMDLLNTLSKDFFKKKIKHKIKKEAIANIEENRKNGYTIVFATASFGVYIKDIADYLNADYFFSTKAAVIDNKLVAKIDGKNCKGREKITIICNEIPEASINKEESLSYSDCLSDLPFLDLTHVFYHVEKKKWKVIKEITADSNK